MGHGAGPDYLQCSFTTFPLPLPATPANGGRRRCLLYTEQQHGEPVERIFAGSSMVSMRSERGLEWIGFSIELKYEATSLQRPAGGSGAGLGDGASHSEPVAILPFWQVTTACIVGLMEGIRLMHWQAISSTFSICSSCPVPRIVGSKTSICFPLDLISCTHWTSSFDFVEIGTGRLPVSSSRRTTPKLYISPLRVATHPCPYSGGI